MSSSRILKKMRNGKEQNGGRRRTYGPTAPKKEKEVVA